jgi:hypothetical protein
LWVKRDDVPWEQKTNRATRILAGIAAIAEGDSSPLLLKQQEFGHI